MAFIPRGAACMVAVRAGVANALSIREQGNSSWSGVTRPKAAAHPRPE